MISRVVQKVFGFDFLMPRFPHQLASFYMKTQHLGKFSNFPLMFIVYDELLWKEIRENSPEDIYSDFYKGKREENKETREKLRKL